MADEKGVAKRTTLERIEHSKKIDEAIAKCGAKAIAGLPVLAQGLRIAEGMRFLQQILDDDMMEGIMLLMDNPLGFMTDRAKPKPGEKKRPYSLAEVRNVTIEGLLRGVFPVNNQINILASRCYITQSGFRHLVKEVDGLTNKEVYMRVGKVSPGEVIVEASAKWKINGVDELIETYEIPVRVYPGQGADLALGKADRKLHKAIYERITGSYLPDGDIDSIPPGKGDVIDIEQSAASDIQDRMAKARKATPKTAKTEPAPKPPEEPEKPAETSAAPESTTSGIPDDVFKEMVLAVGYRPDANRAWLLAMGDDTAPDWGAQKFLAEHARLTNEAKSPLKGLDALVILLENEAKGE